LSPGWLVAGSGFGGCADQGVSAGAVDQIIEVTGTREVRRRLLPVRLVVYFVLALWLFPGRSCGYGLVMSKLVEGLYHRRRGELLLEGLPVDPEGSSRPAVAVAERLQPVAGARQAGL
jgi:hypothetical protein